MPAHAKESILFAMVYPSVFPYTYSLKNEYDGIGPAVIRRWAEHHGIDVTFQSFSRQAAEAALYLDKADMSLLAPAWLARANTLLFSKPILMHREFLYATSEIPKGTGLPDNNAVPFTICVIEGFVYPALDAGFMSGKYIRLSATDGTTQLNMLQKGRCRFAHLSELQAQWLISKMGLEKVIYQAPMPLIEEALTFAVTQRNKALMPGLNAFIDKLNNSQEMKDIVAEQMAKALKKKYRE
ncbi:transporter substrate-binding domain-containing protein [Aliiglaciecola sp. CAU 1673]|uniref:substrate-binding periplasmic protein n=1 Tax=Aliiglaciecola sp. CAU 1673 TaxID=3032595 RepID=UPI0023DB780A|nr:transporter substrate-binding domain-containing protein [Aliiglaciecola sp. CAU 1673]MDF2178629.1 transporter substrate-binding domain-containing protein [Aliiglaciecola sp. CAU 1673]